MRRPQTFAKSSPYFWLHRTKVRWRFGKILWPSQNIWTLLWYKLCKIAFEIKTPLPFCIIPVQKCFKFFNQLFVGPSNAEGNRGQNPGSISIIGKFLSHDQIFDNHSGSGCSSISQVFVEHVGHPNSLFTFVSKEFHGHRFQSARRMGQKIN